MPPPSSGACEFSSPRVLFFPVASSTTPESFWFSFSIFPIFFSRADRPTGQSREPAASCGARRPVFPLRQKLGPWYRPGGLEPHGVEATSATGRAFSRSLIVARENDGGRWSVRGQPQALPQSSRGPVFCAPQSSSVTQTAPCRARASKQKTPSSLHPTSPLALPGPAPKNESSFLRRFPKDRSKGPRSRNTPWSVPARVTCPGRLEKRVHFPRACTFPGTITFAQRPQQDRAET